MRFIQLIFLLVLAILTVGCNDNNPKNQEGPQDTSDLEFSKAKSPKEFADLALYAVKTNRGKVLANQLNKDSLNARDLQKTVHAFGQAINRKGWDMEESETTKDSSTYVVDYSWYDKKNRETVKISIAVFDSLAYQLKSINFDSRIEALESEMY